MKTFKDCVCIAQARVIAGFKRDSHICTIAFQPEKSRFLRLCVPYVKGRSPVVKRWTWFDFVGQKESLPSIDTREESWDAIYINRKGLIKKESEKRKIHCAVLSEYRYQNELKERRESIGLLIPIPGSLRFNRRELSPYDPAEKKKLDRIEHMTKQGIWFPSYEVKVTGEFMQAGKRKKFNRQLLAWDVYEALRSGLTNPFQAITNYRNPYFITGNTSQHRDGFMLIGVLSAPDGAIENYAINQQLALLKHESN